MTDESKKLAPAYTTYKSFINLIKDLRENGIPPHITYSVVKGSNSGKSVMLASLKALGLIDDNKEPTESLRKLVEDEVNYKTNLRFILKDSYPFLFEGDIDLSNTTTEQVSGLFKKAGANGSTISKGMGFFLGAAKEAGIAVSSRVKPPQSPKSSGSRKKSPKTTTEDKAAVSDNEHDIPEGTERVSFTLRGMPDVVVFFPEGLESDEDIRRVINATVFNLELYYGLSPEN